MEQVIAVELETVDEGQRHSQSVEPTAD